MCCIKNVLKVRLETATAVLHVVLRAQFINAHVHRTCTQRLNILTASIEALVPLGIKYIRALNTVVHF